MDRNDILASLLAQAGTEPRDLGTLRAIVEEATDAGVALALERLGLSDKAAPGDIGELRELLGAWRIAKRGAWSALVDWLVRGLIALVLVGIAVRMGFAPWPK